MNLFQNNLWAQVGLDMAALQLIHDVVAGLKHGGSHKIVRELVRHKLVAFDHNKGGVQGGSLQLNRVFS